MYIASININKYNFCCVLHANIKFIETKYNIVNIVLILNLNLFENKILHAFMF